MPLELTLVVALRALTEVAGYFVLGQAILYVVAGSKREQNFVYKLLQVLTRPVFRLTRKIMPKLVLDRHVPFVAFGLLFWLWIALAVLKRHLCALHQLSC